MTVNFNNLGPLVKELRTPAVCEKCGNYIYKMWFHDENSKEKNHTKLVFVCKNCHNNSKK